MKSSALCSVKYCSILLLSVIWLSPDAAGQTHIVTLNRQGGTGGTDQVTVVTGKPMPVALSPIKEEYVFNGYFDAEAGGKQYYTPAMASASDWDKTENTTLYAQWITLPESFSWGDYQGQNWVSTPKNQGQCGSCWAFSMAASYEARKRIAENQPSLVIDLSEQQMVSCWKGDCSGGGTPGHFQKFVDEGVPDEACFPYVATAVECSPCTDWTTRVYKAASWAYQSNASIAEIKREIMVNGPVYATMDVYEDFIYYSGGVYSHVTGDFRGGKAVIVYGWDDTNDCWLVVNTWGTFWGELGPGGTKGFFRVKITENNWGFAKYVFKIRPVRDYILHYPGELEITRDSGASAEFSITTGTDWTVSSDESWLTLSTPGDNGNAMITATASSENTSTVARTATITIRARRIDDITLTVTQQGVPASEIQAENIIFSYLEDTQAQLSWTAGNGTARAVFLKQAPSGTAAPVDGITYTASSSFGAGTQIGETGWYCVYNGTDSTVSVTDITPNVSYTAMVCEYNGTTGTEKYNISTGIGNPVSFAIISVGDLKAQKPFNPEIYPLPFNDKLSINNASDVNLITITSLTGQIIKSVENKGSENLVIPAEDILEGLYILYLKGTSGINQSHLIIKTYR